MQTISSREAQNHFGDMMNQAIKGPVLISKYGKPSAVLISHEKYLSFNAMEDLYWSTKAREASKKGYLTPKASRDFLDSILND